MYLSSGRTVLFSPTCICESVFAKINLEMFPGVEIVL